MKLYLVQHGQAYSKDLHPDRPLTDQGKEDVDRLAAFLKQAGIHVDRVIHSGKLRAIQTAERLAKAIAPEAELEASRVINPNDHPTTFDRKSESWNRDTLVVGHMPFMSKLVSYLVVEDENRLLITYQPGSIVCLERDSKAYWQVNWMIRPELLKRKRFS